MADNLWHELESLARNATDEATLDTDLMVLLLETAEPEVREGLRLCALPHWFDASILATLRGDENDDAAGVVLEQIAKYSFVYPCEPGGYVFHEAVRERLLEAWQESEHSSQQTELNARLWHYFANLIEAEGDPTFRLVAEALYHRLRAQPEDGFIAWEGAISTALGGGQLAHAQQFLELAREAQQVLPAGTEKWLVHYEIR